MKRNSTIFFQLITVIIGISVLAFLIWEPQVEGRNAHATLFGIYFKDPFLAYAYVASIPFFVVLFQTFKALGCIRRNEAFSPQVMKALQIVKYCALAIIGFVMVGEVFIMLNTSDDRAGGVFMGVLFAFISSIIAVIATKFERILQNR